MKSKLDCCYCDKTFSTPSNLLRHHRKIHKLEADTSKKICQCDLCGRRFSSVPCLRRHQKNKHAIRNLVKCDTCKSSFRSTAKYDAHLQSCHLVEAVKNAVIGINTLKDPKTASPTKDKPTTKQGVLVNCEIEDEDLELCEKGQPPTSTNPKEAIACKKCLLTFKRKSYLFAHAIKCKGENCFKTCPISDECHFRYRLRSTLKTHLKSVHDCDSEPEMQCKRCLLTFARLSTLKDHVKICKGPPSKKLLTCPISTDCHFRARFKRTITLHLKKVHNFDIDPPCEMKFNNWEEFMIWKKKEEDSSGSCFTSQSGMKNGKSFFYCQKDGTDKPHTSVPRKSGRTLKKGRVKTGAFCSAYIRYNINSDDTISVTYIHTHSHPVENCANQNSPKRSPSRRSDTNEGSIEEAEVVSPLVPPEMDAYETLSESALPEASKLSTITSAIATEDNKISPNFAFKVHEDEMVTVLYLTSDSQELPEGVFEYVNSTDGTQDSAVIEIHSTDTCDSETLPIDDPNSHNSNFIEESTVAAVIEIDNSQPAIPEQGSIPDKTIWKSKIKSTMEDILTLLESDYVEESALSSVWQSLQTCKRLCEINSSP